MDFNSIKTLDELMGSTPKTAQPMVVNKPFLRVDNIWMWVLGAGAYFGYSYITKGKITIPGMPEKKGRKRKK